jgi:hypothetical protein
VLFIGSSIAQRQSCGYAVPFFDFKAHRTRLLTWAQKKEELDCKATEGATREESGLVEGLKRYWNTKNLRSLDGLEGLTVAPYTSDPFPVKDLSYKPDNETVKKGRLGSHIMGMHGVEHLLVGFSLGVIVASVWMRMSQ